MQMTVMPRAVRVSGLAEKEAKSALGAEDASPDGFGHAGKLQAAQEHQGRVPQAREHCRPFADAAGVLAQGHVPHIVQPVPGDRVPWCSRWLAAGRPRSRLVVRGKAPAGG